MTHVPRIDVPNPLKKLLPKSLFARALLILVLPTVLVQLIATYIFYDRHWENVSRWMASSLAGEIALLVHELNEADREEQKELKGFAAGLMAMRVNLDLLPDAFAEGGASVSPLLYRELQSRLTYPFSLAVSEDNENLEIRVMLEKKLLTLTVSRKRIVSGTTTIFISWMLGTAALLLGIALVFLRNQIRPISKLAEAMDAFGRGQDMYGFRPQGADEVRRAGRAFLQMKLRLERMMGARMDMLAGISHDLRTPLTRLKLGLEMLGNKKDAVPLQQDVQEMEHMIAEYLDFVRGEGQELPQALSLEECLAEVVEGFRRQGYEVAMEKGAPVMVNVRPHVFRRALNNLVGNAVRYGGKKCAVAWVARRQQVEIAIDDAGPGIPLESREEVFKPFRRLDVSRNAQTGGVGLGLTIARDIIQAHGGEIFLQDSPTLGGLRVVVKLPLR